MRETEPSMSRLDSTVPSSPPLSPPSADSSATSAAPGLNPGPATTSNQPPRPLTIGDQAFLHFNRLHPGEFLNTELIFRVGDPTLTGAQVRTQVVERLRAAPALRERLTASTVPPAEASWEIDPEPDPDYHVCTLELPAGSGDDGLRAAAERIAASPLDQARPLWQLWLLHGHRDDSVDLMYRFNHIHQDGTAVHTALRLLFGPDGDAAPPALPALGTPGPRDYARFAGDVLRGIPRNRPLHAWGGPARGAVQRSWAMADVETLRRIGTRHAASVNDVYLAALTGALRTWSLTEWHNPRRALHIAMPINVRRPTEAALMSNFTCGARISLPCGEDDPHRRLARISAQSRRIKADGSIAAVQRHLMEKVSPKASPEFLSRLASAGSRPREAALVASNMGSLRGRYSVAGRPLQAMIVIPPLFLGRQHLSVALGGVGSQVCAGFATSASVPGHDRLAGLWLDELAVLDGGHSQGA